MAYVTSLKITERLQTIHTMDMNTLIHELNQVQALQTQTPTTKTYTFSVLATIIGIFGFILFIAFRQGLLKSLATCKSTVDDRIDNPKHSYIVHYDNNTSAISTENNSGIWAKVQKYCVMYLWSGCLLSEVIEQVTRLQC